MDFGAEPAISPGHVSRARGDVDMDWDEEDEKTTVFEKAEAPAVYGRPEFAASPFSYGPPPPSPGSSPPSSYGPASPPFGSYLPPPPMGPLNTPPPATPGLGLAPPPTMSRSGTFLPAQPPPSFGRTPPGATAPPTMGLPTLAPPTLDLSHLGLANHLAPARSHRNRYLLGAALLGAALTFFVASRRSGKVSVFTSSANGRPLTKLAIYVDGVQKCSATPCNLELPKGIHAIRASADGYAPQEQGTTVQAGDEFALNFKLERASGGTGIKVTGKQDGVELFVDGRQVGPLPQEVKDLAPGSHTVMLRGNERYAPEERTVTIENDEIKNLGAVNLKVLRGLASFDVRTPGVKVTLVSGKDRRQLTDFSQPVEIETSKSWTIEATRPGFDDFRQPITFDDRAERKFVIALQERQQPAPVVAAPAVAAPASQRSIPEPRPGAEPIAQNDSVSDEPSPARSGASGSCTLNFNSIPVSSVVLDGKPLGGTPKMGVAASAGPHTVMFVSPDETRKIMSVTCKPGESKTVGVRLNQP